MRRRCAGFASFVFPLSPHGTPVLFCLDVQRDFNWCMPMLAPREDPSADFVLPLASFDGAALSFMRTSQNVPDTLVFHFEAGADSATLDMPVVL